MPLNTLHFGAIDIGSNAVRLLIASVEKLERGTNPKKSILVRVPIRLGEDVFSTGKISRKRLERLVRLMSAYKSLLQVYDVADFRVCGTSAMREAENRDEAIRSIKRETGMQVEVIDGKEEARIIYESHIADLLSDKLRYIYVDVGGGSTEITLIENKKLCESRSFNIGTLRILARKVGEEEWQQLDDWLETIRKGKQPLEIIGSGGNINKLYRLTKLDEGEKLGVGKLKHLYNHLKKTSVEERITRLEMRPDRADVIIPAAEIFLRIAKVAKIKHLNVPTIGLADGIVHLLHQEYRKHGLKR
jgi:exopolyphosphatase/guanosine-5'-triphosphate,3'-diphosphate pyrophosphatase